MPRRWRRTIAASLIQNRTKSATSGPQSESVDCIAITGKYQHPDLIRSVWQLFNSVVPFVIIWYLMYRSLEISFLITLLLSVPAAGFLVRIFIIFHDCGHGSFFKSKKWNDRFGMAFSVFTFVPYYYWRRIHSLHHSAAGDLENRGVGDFYTMTVKEYTEKSKWERFQYRLYRHPIVMFVIAPVFVFIVVYRFDYMGRKDWKKERRGLLWTNLALGALVVTMSLLRMEALAALCTTLVAIRPLTASERVLSPEPNLPNFLPGTRPLEMPSMPASTSSSIAAVRRAFSSALTSTSPPFTTRLA